MRKREFQAMAKKIKKVLIEEGNGCGMGQKSCPVHIDQAMYIHDCRYWRENFCHVLFPSLRDEDDDPCPCYNLTYKHILRRLNRAIKEGK